MRVEAEPVSGGVTLSFRVQERPAIAEVLFTGNDEIEDSDIKEKVPLEEGSVLSEPTVREQLEKIRGSTPRRASSSRRSATSSSHARTIK